MIDCACRPLGFKWALAGVGTGVLAGVAMVAIPTRDSMSVDQPFICELSFPVATVVLPSYCQPSVVLT